MITFQIGEVRSGQWYERASLLVAFQKKKNKKKHNFLKEDKQYWCVLFDFFYLFLPSENQLGASDAASIYHHKKDTHTDDKAWIYKKLGVGDIYEQLYQLQAVYFQVTFQIRLWCFTCSSNLWDSSLHCCQEVVALFFILPLCCT